MEIREQIQTGVNDLLGGFLNRAEQEGNAEFRQALDFENFARNKLFIQTKARKLVKFKMNRTQRAAMAILRNLKKEKKPVRIICLKTRQGGFSTFTEAFLFHDTISNANTNSLVCAHELSSSKHLFQMTKRFYENLPEDEQPPVLYSSRQEMAFEGLNSRFMVDTANKKATLEGTEAGTLGRSFTIQNAHCSEIAFWMNAEVVMDALMAAIPDHIHTSIFIESTGNTTGDYMYKEWDRARSGLTDFVPLFVPWFWVEEYTRPLSSPYPPFTERNGKNELELTNYEIDLVEKDKVNFEQINWMRWKVANSFRGDTPSFQKNFPSSEDEAFSGTHSPYFDMGKLRELLKSAEPATKIGNFTMKDPIEPDYDDFEPFPKLKLEFVRSKTGFLSIWANPVKGEEYLIGADVGEGIAIESGRRVGSYSAGVVFNRRTKMQPATWHGHLDPDSFGDELYKLGHFYNTAWIVCEVNNHGLTTLTRLKRLGYPKIYYRYALDEKLRRKTKKIGWNTTLMNRDFALDFLVTLVREGCGEILDPKLLRECLTFVKNMRKNGRGEPASGCFGDLVMASAVGLAGNHYIGIQERLMKQNRQEEPWNRASKKEENYKFGFSKEFYEAGRQ